MPWYLMLWLAGPVYGAMEDWPRLEATAIHYLGSFLAPTQDRIGTDMTFGGYALGIDPVRQGLYFGCHDYLQRLAELAIPPLEVASTPMATVLQDCTDVTEGRLPLVDDYLPRLGGTLHYGERLLVSAFGDYDADYSQILSHFVTAPDFTITGEVQGPFQVGNQAGVVAGYMTPIPAEWRAAFGGPALTGQCCINIISRSSAGPAVSVFDPDELGTANPVLANQLLGYPLEHPLGEPASQNPWFNHTTRITGLAFPPGSRSVLFIGRHGVGPYCYDTAEACGDPFDAYKGPHAPPYVHQVWAYDALELLKVKRGELQPWAVLPYAIWPLPEMDQSGAATLSGATYDPGRSRLYITEGFGEEADGHRVHVYAIDVPALPRLINLSTRAQVGTGDNVLIGGLVIGGSMPHQVLIRAIGPSMASAGVSDTLANPQITLTKVTGEVVASNDNWQDDPQAGAIAAPMQPTHPNEAALLLTLQPGVPYTPMVSGVGGTTGVALVEVYDVDDANTFSRLVNLSTRARAGTGDKVMIGGFVIGGSQPKKVLIRAIGPSLASAGVADTLANPNMTLTKVTGEFVANNDNWQDGPNAAELQTLGRQPANPNESALLLVLQPNVPYTPIVEGVGGTQGVALVEVYEVP